MKKQLLTFAFVSSIFLTGTGCSSIPSPYDLGRSINDTLIFHYDDIPVYNNDTYCGKKICEQEIVESKEFEKAFIGRLKKYPNSKYCYGITPDFFIYDSFILDKPTQEKQCLAKWQKIFSSKLIEEFDDRLNYKNLNYSIKKIEDVENFAKSHKRFKNGVRVNQAKTFLGLTKSLWRDTAFLWSEHRELNYLEISSAMLYF